MDMFRQMTANNVVLEEYPFWKELAMEAYLMENEEILRFDKKNFSDVSVVDAEIALKQGRKNGDGRIDMMVKYAGEYLGIVEIKMNMIDERSLLQLQDYIDQKDALLKLSDEYWTEQAAPKWVAVLIGTDISGELRDKLSASYSYKGVPVAGMTIRRFKSLKNEIFVISDVYFRYNYSNKDYSVFVFNGGEYGKGSLVNAVVRFWVETHPDIPFAELKGKFPDKLQGSYGVFVSKCKADENYAKTGYKRYQLKPEKEIKLTDEIICTCSEWRPENMSWFLQRCKELGLLIQIK